MFKRKLLSLDHHNPNNFNINDENEFRNLIVWLEDQKIRHNKIEDREKLRNICGGDWEAEFQKYLDDLESPVKGTDKSAATDWLLGYAVRLEFGDNVDRYKGAKGFSASNSTDKKSSNPLDQLDFNDSDFKAGVTSLATLLQIPPHPDHLVQLKAVCLLIKEKLSKRALERLQKEGIQASSTMTLDKVDLGFETTDYITAEAGRILRLLHIQELRELQDGANEAIVCVQGLTANPKTDTKLGKVGRL